MIKQEFQLSSYEINRLQFLDQNCNLERMNQEKPGILQLYLFMWFLSHFSTVWGPVQFLNVNGWQRGGSLISLQKGNEGA